MSWFDQQFKSMYPGIQPKVSVEVIMKGDEIAQISRECVLIQTKEDLSLLIKSKWVANRIDALFAKFEKIKSEI